MLRYTRMGPQDGPVVVFLHAVGISSWMWHSVVAHMPEVQTLLIDLPGHGDSNALPWQDLSTTAKAVADVIEQEASGKPVHLIGLSLGAYVGMTLLSQQPQRFETAFLSGMHAGGMPNRWAMRTLSTLMAPFATRPFFARKTAGMLGGDTADVDAFVAEAGRTRPQAFRRASIDAVEYALPDNLERIEARVMVASGSKEHPLILHSLDEITSRIPHSGKFQAQGLGHGWSGQDPALFAQVALAHMAGDDVP